MSMEISAGPRVRPEMINYKFRRGVEQSGSSSGS